MQKHIHKLTLLFLTLCLVIAGAISSPSRASAAKIKLSKKSVTITKGKSVTLKLKGTKKKPKWSTSNKKIATVSKKGKVVGKKAGNAKITAKIGKKKYVCKVKVTKPKPVPRPVPEPTPQPDPSAPVVLNETNCEYVVEKDGTVTVKDFPQDKEWTSIIIPATLGGRPVKVVDDIIHHKKLVEVVISEGITEITDEAFLMCPNLIKITIPSSVIKIMGKKPGYYTSQYDENGNYILDEYGRPIPLPAPVPYGSIFVPSDHPNLTIYGKPGSFAEEFANKQGISFKPL